MTKNPKTTTTQEELRSEVDRAALTLVEALANYTLSPDRGEPSREEALAALTEEDREALAGLGTSEELVQRVMAEVERQSPLQSEVPTVNARADETIQTPGNRSARPANQRAFGKLMASLRRFEQAEQVSWTWTYRKKRVLGEGGQGVVFLTERQDRVCGEQAMKIFSPKPYQDVVAYRADTERMADVARQVSRIHHDNLLNVDQVFDHKGIFVMLMQLIDGYDLQRLLQYELQQYERCAETRDIESAVAHRRTTLNDVVFIVPEPKRLCVQPGFAANIAEKCLRGLDTLHAAGIVHGDIKPANIMLDVHGSIKLIDFGSAFQLSDPPQRHTWTPCYAAPEFHERGEWTPRSDLASLGYVLIELLSGKPAISVPGADDRSTRSSDHARDRALLEAKRQLPDRFEAMLPPGARRSEGLKGLCRRLIQPDPEARFATASEAITGHYGTFNFNKELTRGDLVVCYAQEIKRWLGDVRQAGLDESEFSATPKG